MTKCKKTEYKYDKMQKDKIQKDNSQIWQNTNVTIYKKTKYKYDITQKDKIQIWQNTTIIFDIFLLLRVVFCHICFVSFLYYVIFSFCLFCILSLFVFFPELCFDRVVKWLTTDLISWGQQWYYILPFAGIILDNTGGRIWSIARLDEQPLT